MEIFEDRKKTITEENRCDGKEAPVFCYNCIKTNTMCFEMSKIALVLVKRLW